MKRLRDMALPGCVLDQNHFTDADHASFTIARAELKSRIEADHILPARRWMGLRKRPDSTCSRSFENDDADGRQAPGHFKAPRRLVGALNLNFAEMCLAISVGK